jgi:hypothetical protein
MQDYQWVPWVVGMLSGGAMGAIITAVVTNYRNRIQPIGHRVEVIQFFKDNIGLSSLRAQLTLSDGRTSLITSTIYIARVTIMNKGNQDISDFTFGMTLSGEDKVVHVQTEAPDRHHAALTTLYNLSTEMMSMPSTYSFQFLGANILLTKSNLAVNTQLNL